MMSATHVYGNSMPRSREKPITVAIIEDYKLTRYGIKSFLSRFDYIDFVGEAEDAIQGLNMVRLLRPDVVLMDLGLPKMDGIEATRRLKEMDKNIKVIILTSHEREEEVIAAFGAGANGYCLKDVDPNRLAEIIETIYEGGAWLDPAIASVALKINASGHDVSAFTSSKSSANKSNLTEREMEVLRLVVEGKSNTEIADELIVSVHTAKAHVCNILQKLYVNDRVQAAVKAIREGLV